MDYVFSNRLKSLEMMRRDGQTKGWEESKIKAYIAHQKKLKRERKNKRLKEIDYQDSVLERMEERGCKPCEAARQRKHIEQLKGSRI